MELKSGGRILRVAGDPRQTFVAKSPEMVFLFAVGNCVRAAVLSGITQDRAQPDPGETVVGGDRDDGRAAGNRCGSS